MRKFVRQYGQWKWIYKEKAGDFILDIAKLVFAGVILASVVSEDINRVWLYVIGSLVFATCCAVAFLLYKILNRKEQ